MLSLRRLMLACLVTVNLLPGAGCTSPAASSPNWQPADLRILDPADADLPPEQDLLAAYTRLRGSDLEIRFDLLDLMLGSGEHYQVLLDTQPGGDPWDLVVELPSTGMPSITHEGSGIRPRVVRDPWLDTVTVRFNRLDFPRPFTFQVLSLAGDPPMVIDATARVRSDALPPVSHASVALMFWNVFPAETPLQALRSWDGAHTGPSRASHGLKNLLAQVDAYRLPVVLLDLKTSPALPALAAMDKLTLVQELAGRGLLILPQPAHLLAPARSLTVSRELSSAFELPVSRLAFLPGKGLFMDETSLVRAVDCATSHAGASFASYMPLPDEASRQATSDGLSLELRRNLVASALSPDPAMPLVLGGDFSTSTWGNADSAAPAFAWLAAHPWIHLLDSAGLQSLPLDRQVLTAAPPSPAQAAALVALQTAPQGPLTRSAWQMFFSLTAPSGDPELVSLRLQYLGGVHQFLFASQWAHLPFTRQVCETDLDLDGQPDCVLASLQALALLDPEGGILTHFFYLEGNDVHQLVAPSSQFAVGLSDPSEWRLDLGEQADPAVIAGAFKDPESLAPLYIPLMLPDGIVFTAPADSTQKTYRLVPGGLQMTWQGKSPSLLTLPVALDPWRFFDRGIPTDLLPFDRGWLIGQAGGVQVEFLSATPTTAASYAQALPLLRQPEDPDIDYPRGASLPFPLTVFSSPLNGGDSILLRIRE